MTSALSCDQLSPITADRIRDIYTDHQGTNDQCSDDQCSPISATCATCQCPSVPPVSAHQCTSMRHISAYQCNQCHISVPI
ncbi:unnamed protein product [Staurois parvus]|uniref:Uncharacterized protein n=1 Tax=Staurois parvus TaxID=386267 RepID=A0ABN9CIX4_9NEOB|nr:unnamed protein product [Staurois parvus]